jgi:hypothetical protein
MDPDGSNITSIPIGGSVDWQRCIDGDSDGLLDCDDNCVGLANPQQENYDNDDLGDPCDPDDDNDGCADVDEQQMGLGTETSGGLRNYQYFWDFFDVPTGASLQRDRAITGLDFFALLARLGSSGDPGIDALSTPAAAPAYHTAYDRSSPAPGGDPWDSGPADGAIAGTDFFLVLAQFGHSCA